MQSTDKKTPSSQPENKPLEEHTTEALEQTEKDISTDRDLGAKPDPTADLDEGELARLEGED